MVRLGSPMVEASGLEPPTPTLSGWCSNLLSYASIYENEHDARFLLFTARGSGGDERDRTADPLLARQVLSQLSYTPIGAVSTSRRLRVCPIN